MIKLVDECNKIIAKYSKNIENKLNVTSTVQILKEVLPDHYFLGESSTLEGVISDETKIIVIYPHNIWLNHCALIPEEYMLKEFKWNVIRVYVHEMRHLWQIENNLFYSNNAEIDADNFALKYINALLKKGEIYE